MKRIALLSLVLLVLVIPHIVSADTLLVYATHVDVAKRTTPGSFSQIRSGTGDSITEEPSAQCTYISASDTSNEYNGLYRIILSFNTSVIGSSSTISSGILSLKGTSKYNGLGSPSIGVTKVTLSSQGAPQVSDYNKHSNDYFADAISYSSYSTSSWNNFTFNSLGISNISKTSWTDLMVRTGTFDIENTNPTWATFAYSRHCFSGASQGSNTPQLTIVYSTSVPTPVASFTASKTFIRIPNLISVTDTSTNTPTSWEWSWGDGSANSTTQNPTHQYKKRGKFPIILTATNAGGSGTTSAYNVRVAGYEN